MYGKEDEDFNNGVQYKNPALTDGFRISGALSGLSGSFHSDLEPRLRQDSIFYSNQFNLDWYGHKKSRHLNPIGISYGKNIGVGTLFAFFEARGIEGGERVTGYNPRYRYLGLGIAGGTNTLNSNEIELSITDGGLGYQFNFNKLFITPKVSGRHFNTNFAQYTFFSGNLVGIEFYELQTNSSAIFLGTKLQYLLNEIFSIFLEASTNTFTPINGNDTGSLHQITGYTNNILYYTSATLAQQVISSRLHAGYQYNFRELGMVFGYQQETIATSYSKFTSLPVYIDGNNFNFNTNQYLLDRFILYKNPMNTEIKSFYISLVYAY